MVNTALSCVVSFALGAAFSVFISKSINGKRKRKGFPRPAFEQQPHPCWAPKQPQPCPYPGADEMVAVDPSSYDKASS